MSHTLFILAGESSGDHHGASLARSLREREPDITLVGMGGHRMREAGVEVVHDVTAHAAVGIVETFGVLRRINAVFHAMIAELDRRRPVDRKTKAFRAQRTETVLLLATDLLDLPAELIALIYRCRWQIELFFRWFKIILKADHLLSQSRNGLTIVIYCALIASLLIVLWTGRKPTKRTYEMLCHYFAGWVEDDEWEAYLGRLRRAVA